MHSYCANQKGNTLDVPNPAPQKYLRHLPTADEVDEVELSSERAPLLSSSSRGGAGDARHKRALCGVHMLHVVPPAACAGEVAAVAERVDDRYGVWLPARATIEQLKVRFDLVLRHLLLLLLLPFLLLFLLLLHMLLLLLLLMLAMGNDASHGGSIAQPAVRRCS